MTPERHGGWTAESYTAFALRSQMASLWLLACWIAREARSAGGLGPEDRVLDLAAGPGILARLVSMRMGIAVDAAAQSGAFMAAAAGLQEVAGLGGIVAMHPMGGGLQEHYPFVYSYAYLHEAPDQGYFLEAAGRAVAPEGRLLVFDTFREAWPAVQAALSRPGGRTSEHAAIEGTFRDSLSLEEARRLAGMVLPGARVASVDVDDELLMEVQLTMPDGWDLQQGLEVQEPTIFVIAWQRPSMPSGVAPATPAGTSSLSDAAHIKARNLERRAR